MSTETLMLALAILSSSFFGSWHCAVMCGPIASLMAHRKSLLSYHLGRGMSYIALGALGGLVGSFFLNNSFRSVRIFSAFFFATLLIGMGIQISRGKKSSFTLSRWIHSLYRPGFPGFTLGLISVFLPCGWLYSYVLAAAATHSALSGAVVMSLFWLGGLPSLSALSLWLRQSIQMVPRQKQITAGLILVFAGLYSLMSFYWS
jgi:sulfite exporter TauE/SafE